MRKNNVRFLIPLSYALVFSIIYFYFLTLIFVTPNEQNPPILLYFGLFLPILGFFYYFFYFNTQNKKEIKSIKFVNENTIKIVLTILMIISFFSVPNMTSEVIIEWSRIPYQNIIRSSIFLLGSIYLPGSSIYKLFLEKIDVPKKLNVEPFLIKITLYPLISFSLLGTSSLILESLGLQRQYFSVTLLAIILSLIALDFIYKNRVF